MSRVFVLEDDKIRISAFRQALIGIEHTIATTYDEAVATFAPPYDLICLDHDLGDRVMVNSDDPNTGYQFVKWLIRQGPSTTPIIIHSFNPEGSRRMFDSLLGAGHTAYRITYGPKVLHAVASLAGKS